MGLTNQMRVLVIRSEPAASETANKLRALNHEAIVFPMSRYVCDVDFDIEQTQNASGLIFTSANAIRCLIKCNTLTQSIKQLPIFCVGARTAELAKEMGFSRIHSGEGGGRALAPIIKNHQFDDHLKPSQQTPLVYLTLKNRTVDFERALENTDIFIKPVIIYDVIADFSDHALKMRLENDHIEVILFYAKSAVRRFFASVEQTDANLFTNLRFGCLSKEIAGAIPQKYADQIDIASKPNEIHLLACIG